MQPLDVIVSPHSTYELAFIPDQKILVESRILSCVVNELDRVASLVGQAWGSDGRRDNASHQFRKVGPSSPTFLFSPHTFALEPLDCRLAAHAPFRLILNRTRRVNWAARESHKALNAPLEEDSNR